MEFLIVIALIALLATALLILFNPKKQIEKAWDAKRKNQLSELKKVLEDWYNDKNCYPKPSEICFDSPTANNTCHICGNQSTSPSFSPYLSSLPCDPQSPKKDYLYQVDNLTCPNWYRVYADLSLSDYLNNDPATEEVGCYNQSCGPSPNYNYDYGISSPNIDLERSVNFSYCARTGCNICGSYQNCLNIWQTNPNLFCHQKKIIAPASYCGKQSCPCQP
jgi:type II secretory pathway pseudopilin PulG